MLLVSFSGPVCFFVNTNLLYILEFPLQMDENKIAIVWNLRLRLHLHLLLAAALCPLGTSTWRSNSLIMLTCHASTKDEAMLTSSSEYSHGRLPHCTLNNVLYLIIECGTFILFNYTGTSSNTSTGTVRFSLYCCLHVTAQLHLTNRMMILVTVSVFNSDKLEIPLYTDSLKLWSTMGVYMLFVEYLAEHWRL